MTDNFVSHMQTVIEVACMMGQPVFRFPGLLIGQDNERRVKKLTGRHITSTLHIKDQIGKGVSRNRLRRFNCHRDTQETNLRVVCL
jgi:hypothetical protein